MIVRLLLLLAALAMAGCGADNEPATPPTPALWEVTSPDGGKGWLFGTIHALPDGTQWRSDALSAAFDEAGVLVVEIANLDDPNAGPAAFEKLAYSPQLGPFWGRWGYGFDEQVDILVGSNDAILRPGIEEWAAALQIASVLQQGESGNGVDRALMASDMQRLGLETFAEQFGIFDQLSREDQKALLDAIVFEESKNDPLAMVTPWLAGDLDALHLLTSTGILADPEVREALLTLRNHNWAERIAPLIRQGREPFVAVGAAHMLGNDGLPALLEAQGFTIRRIQ